jgi:hypothetical protein
MNHPLASARCLENSRSGHFLDSPPCIQLRTTISWHFVAAARKVLNGHYPKTEATSSPRQGIDASSRDGRVSTLFRPRPNRLTQLHQCPAHAVKLVGQIQNHPHSFIVHAKIHLEITDEPCSGDIDFGEAQLGGRTAGYQPLLLDLGIQHFMPHAGER